MSEQPTVIQIELIRVFMKDGTSVDIQMPVGHLPMACRVMKSDGIIFTPDVAIPWENIRYMARVESLGKTEAPWTSGSKPN